MSGDFFLMCGPQLFASPSAQQVVDEYVFDVYPIAIGRATNPFSRIPDPIPLAFERSIPFPHGVNVQVYTPISSSPAG